MSECDDLSGLSQVENFECPDCGAAVGDKCCEGDEVLQDGWHLARLLCFVEADSGVSAGWFQRLKAFVVGKGGQWKKKP